jgi:hypothetical protein
MRQDGQEAILLEVRLFQFRNEPLQTQVDVRDLRTRMVPLGFGLIEIPSNGGLYAQVNLV